MVRPAPIPSDPARSCLAPCRLPSPPRQCHHNPQQTPPPPRPGDGPVRRETALPWKTAPGWVQHRSPPQHMVDRTVVNPYLTLSKVDSIISGRVHRAPAAVPSPRPARRLGRSRSGFRPDMRRAAARQTARLSGCTPRMRQLLSRLEDEDTGTVRPPELYAQIPAERVAQARHAASALGDAVYTKFPFVSGMSPAGDDLTELVLNRTWRPQLAVIGIDGLPSPGDAGNVLLPYTRAQLSLRLPPTLDAEGAAA